VGIRREIYTQCVSASILMPPAPHNHHFQGTIGTQKHTHSQPSFSARTDITFLFFNRNTSSKTHHAHTHRIQPPSARRDEHGKLSRCANGPVLPRIGLGIVAHVEREYSPTHIVREKSSHFPTHHVDAAAWQKNGRYQRVQRVISRVFLAGMNARGSLCEEVQCRVRA
jgi:hypothetical protein